MQAYTIPQSMIQPGPTTTIASLADPTGSMLSTFAPTQGTVGTKQEPVGSAGVIAAAVPAWTANNYHLSHQYDATTLGGTDYIYNNTPRTVCASIVTPLPGLMRTHICSSTRSTMDTRSATPPTATERLRKVLLHRCRAYPWLRETSRQGSRRKSDQLKFKQQVNLGDGVTPRLLANGVSALSPRSTTLTVCPITLDIQPNDLAWSQQSKVTTARTWTLVRTNVMLAPRPSFDETTACATSRVTADRALLNRKHVFRKVWSAP